MRVLSLEETRRIESELATQPPSVRKIVECPCGLGQWALARERVYKTKLVQGPRACSVPNGPFSLN